MSWYKKSQSKLDLATSFAGIIYPWLKEFDSIINGYVDSNIPYSEYLENYNSLHKKISNKMKDFCSINNIEMSLSGISDTSHRLISSDYRNFSSLINIIYSGFAIFSVDLYR
jgi:hypothetical protein